MPDKKKIVKLTLIVALGVAVLILNVIFLRSIGDIGSLPRVTDQEFVKATP